jgi:hypothetical protein
MMRIQTSKALMEEAEKVARKMLASGEAERSLPSNAGITVSSQDGDIEFPVGGKIFFLRIEKMLGKSALAEKKMLRPY